MSTVTPQQKLDHLSFTTAQVRLAANAATPEQIQRMLEADATFDVYGYIRDEFGKVAFSFLTEEQAAQVIAWIELAEDYAFECADWQVNQ